MNRKLTYRAAILASLVLDGCRNATDLTHGDADTMDPRDAIEEYLK